VGGGDAGPIRTRLRCHLDGGGGPARGTPSV